MFWDRAVLHWHFVFRLKLPPLYEVADTQNCHAKNICRNTALDHQHGRYKHCDTHGDIDVGNHIALCGGAQTDAANARGNERKDDL
ncbi:hypothetical protein SDC9_187811 [bioreactor metagenome]|uniref:Uncharacterized protein n=1 Tax=bioreactor metagenome TaxID=1076179 RepID=A0A645HMJ7_9ZZZZ